MELTEGVLSRRSIRRYTKKHISREDLHTILRAGMTGPSCANTRDWKFIVVRDREMLNRMADANGRPAEPLRRCDVGILILGDLERAFPPAKEYWVIDGAIAGQNMVLAAQGLGIGSVWLGTWPQMDRVEAQKELFSLPDTVVPHSIIAFGYPAEERTGEHPDYEESQVTYYEKTKGGFPFRKSGKPSKWQVSIGRSSAN
ncbi:MAG: nitroreductase family protein [Clostridiales bacterium]|nr:nitroreductase family protein [Clostridiales bacterium]